MYAANIHKIECKIKRLRYKQDSIDWKRKNHLFFLLVHVSWWLSMIFFERNYRPHIKILTLAVGFLCIKPWLKNSMWSTWKWKKIVDCSSPFALSCFVHMKKKLGEGSRVYLFFTWICSLRPKLIVVLAFIDKLVLLCTYT